MVQNLSYWLSDTNDINRLWRSILLFGNNTACYKFALGSTLLEFSSKNIERATIEELAIPFSKKISERLKIEDRQGTNPTSSFLDSCRKYNSKEIDVDELIDATVKDGFRWVLDLFHVVSREEISQHFYSISGKGKNRIIHIKDNLLSLDKSNLNILNKELDSRWKLVETSWALGIPSQLLDVHIKEDREELFVVNTFKKRKPVGKTKWALNGYQNGKCFYCELHLEELDITTHVDHVIPFSLRKYITLDIDHVWNLVNACQNCNLDKFNKLPSKKFIDNLFFRNEWYILSNHPLKDSIIRSTGKTFTQRKESISRVYRESENLMPITW